MKTPKLSPPLIALLSLIIFAVIAIVIIRAYNTRDLSNYVISKEETTKVIGNMKRIAEDPDKFGSYFGGGGKAAYKDYYGSNGGAAIWMGPIGVHKISEPKGKVMRFSSKDHFDTFVLSESLDENPELLATFQEMLAAVQGSREGSTWDLIVDDDHSLKRYTKLTPRK